MPEVVLACVGLEGVEEQTDAFPEVVAASLGCGSEGGLELGKSHFDGIEVGQDCTDHPVQDPILETASLSL